MLVALVVLPPPAGVALYAHIGGGEGGGGNGGGDGGGGDGGGGVGGGDGGGGDGGGGAGGGDGGGGDGGGDGGADGGLQSPSQSTMYSTYTKLPSYAFLSTASVAVVTKVYEPSGLGRSGTYLAHSKKFPT